MAKLNFVLTREAAKELRIIDSEGNGRMHEATVPQVRAAAESEHETFDEAIEAAEATGHDRWVIDSSGDSTRVAGALDC